MNGIHYCQIKNSIFFIDTRNNYYFSIDSSNTPLIIDILDDITDRHNIKTDDTFKRIQENLFILGLDLTIDQIKSLRRKKNLISPIHDLYGYQTITPPRARIRNVLFLIISSLYTKIVLFILPFRYLISIINKMSKIRNNSLKSTKNNIMHDLELYHHLKPFYTSKDNCLFDSILLYNYLFLLGHSTSLSFGILTNPFLAHCWVQHGSFVLNDKIDNVAPSTLIMQI